MNKIAIFSTSSRAIEVIKELANNFEIRLIVTKSDKIVGRKKELVANEVKKFAIEQSIPFIEINKFDTNKKEEVINEISKLDLDLALSIDFGFIIPKKLLEVLKNKFINTHFSLLPKHRGASAVQFAILNDDKNYGITYHLIDETLDTGDIIFQSSYPLNEEFNSDQAYRFLFNKCKEEINKVLQKYINGELKNIPQNHGDASYTYSKTNPKYTFIFKEDAIIDENDTERKIFRKIKAYNPWPLLQVDISDLLKLKQFQNYVQKNENQQITLKINEASYNNNQLNIEELTILNGKKLKINEFINGFLKKK